MNFTYNIEEDIKTIKEKERTIHEEEVAKNYSILLARLEENKDVIYEIIVRNISDCAHNYINFESKALYSMLFGSDLNYYSYESFRKAFEDSSVWAILKNNGFVRCEFSFRLDHREKIGINFFISKTPKENKSEQLVIEDTKKPKKTLKEKILGLFSR